MAFTAALGLVSISQGIVVLLLALIVFYPAGGAFVSLSQVSLMDTDPSRREQNMVRWEFAGSVGNVVGPLALVAAIALSFCLVRDVSVHRHPDNTYFDCSPSSTARTRR